MGCLTEGLSCTPGAKLSVDEPGVASVGRDRIRGDAASGELRHAGAGECNLLVEPFTETGLAPK